MIRLKQLFAFTAALLIAVPAISAVPPIVPRPLSVEQGHGNFTITSATPIAVLTDELHTVAEIFAADIAPLFDGPLSVMDIPARRAISLNLASGLGEEEYTLSVTRRNVAVTGGSPRAVLYGLQSLRQLINGNRIPAVEIRDKPWFAYRGAMLDAARHFFPAADVKKFIDILALHKINRFHWHLTDDQGWRIEIKRYPELTRIGSNRRETIVGFHKTSTTYDDTPYGGYSTQEEIRDVVRYAADRGIVIIPEIEMPGHSAAALASYPWLGCTGGPYEVWTKWGISEDIYCAGKETTFEFLENVLAEVIALFPSNLIHIGGDECPKSRWKKCPFCQQRIRENGLKNEEQLQGYLVRRIEQWLKAHGRNLIGWDEILQGGVTPSAAVMSWREPKYGIAAAQQGNHVIMAPWKNCYLDYYQTSDPEKYGEPLAFPRYLPARQVYRLDPYDQLTPAQQTYILGVQGNLWAEFIADIGHAQRMLLPRLAALAEVGWAYDRKDYNDFVRRMPALRRVYDAAGFAYSPFLFEGIE